MFRSSISIGRSFGITSPTCHMSRTWSQAQSSTTFALPSLPQQKWRVRIRSWALLCISNNSPPIVEAAAEAAGVFLYDDFPSAAQIDPVMPRLQQLITLAERMSRHPVLSQRTEEISGGLSQAVALARVFLRGPSVRFCILVNPVILRPC